MMEYATLDPTGPIEKAEALVFDVGSLAARLASLTDKRGRRGIRYSLTVILLLIVLAKLGGEDRPSGIADWLTYRAAALREALHLRHPRLPHHNTYRRILAEVVSPEELEATLGDFLRNLPRTGRGVLIAMDGKTVRGTIGAEHPQGEHLLAAYEPDAGIVLMQVATDIKENEITVAPTLLKCLDLRDKIVMGDAMHTQRALSAQILEAGGDYIWLVKDNQPTLHEDIAAVFAPQSPTVLGGVVPTDFQTARTVTKGHGRRETREITVSRSLKRYSDWPGLDQVFQIERERVELKTGKVTHETVRGLTSLSPPRARARRLLDLVRAYWGIENGLHHRRDATFHEDTTRQTRGNAGRVMAILNNLLISLLRWAGHTNLAEARRRHDADLDRSLRLVASRPSRL
jgi:predicted transposase YbfD/YdcC